MKKEVISHINLLLASSSEETSQDKLQVSATKVLELLGHYPDKQFLSKIRASVIRFS